MVDRPWRNAARNSLAPHSARRPNSSQGKSFQHLSRGCAPPWPGRCWRTEASPPSGQPETFVNVGASERERCAPGTPPDTTHPVGWLMVKVRKTRGIPSVSAPAPFVSHASGLCPLPEPQLPTRYSTLPEKFRLVSVNIPEKAWHNRRLLPLPPCPCGPSCGFSPAEPAGNHHGSPRGAAVHRGH